PPRERTAPGPWSDHVRPPSHQAEESRIRQGVFSWCAPCQVFGSVRRESPGESTAGNSARQPFIRDAEELPARHPDASTGTERREPDCGLAERDIIVAGDLSERRAYRFTGFATRDDTSLRKRLAMRDAETALGLSPSAHRFVYGPLRDGCVIRVLSVVNDFARVSAAHLRWLTAGAARDPAARRTRAHDAAPRAIVCENGAEFTRQAFD